MSQREDLATVVELKTASVPPSRKASGARVRMTGQERREQLLNVGRKLFAEKGFETVTVEEIAAKADVSKPVVYEHFGGKEGLYAVVVDREMNYLLDSVTQALMGSRNDGASARELVEQAGIDIATQVEDVLAAEFKAHGINDKYAPMYSQMLVGMVAFTGQWWLDVRKPKKEEVVAHLVNLAWNGLRDLDPKPTLTKQKKT